MDGWIPPHDRTAGFNPEVDQRPADFYAFAKLGWALLAGRTPSARVGQLRYENRLATLSGNADLARLDSLFERLLVSDVRRRVVEWSVVERELTAVLRALRGENAAPTGELDLSEAERQAHRYAGSRAFLENRDLQSENERRSEKLGELFAPARNAAEEHATDFARLSEAAAGMEIAVVGMGGLTLAWFEFVLAGIGRHGQPAWKSIPGTTLSIESSALCVIGISRTDETSKSIVAPPEPDLTLSVHAYIENWDVWLVQVPALWAASDDVRQPPFLGAFLCTDGPFHLGLGQAVDAARAAGHRLAEDAVKLFEQYLTVLNAGDDPTDPGAWAKLRSAETEAPTPDADTSGAAEDVIEGLLTRLEEQLEARDVEAAQGVAFELAAAIAKWVDAPREVRVPAGRERFTVRVRVAPLRWRSWKGDQPPSEPVPHLLRAYSRRKTDPMSVPVENSPPFAG